MSGFGTFKISFPYTGMNQFHVFFLALMSSTIITTFLGYFLVNCNISASNRYFAVNIFSHIVHIDLFDVQII